MQAAIASPPDTIIAHYHHGWLIWILFLVGSLLHAALQINSIASAKKMTMEAVAKAVLIPVVFRMFAECMIFLLIWEHPDIISGIMSLFGHPLSADETAVFNIPMNNAIAGLYGLFLDSLLGYIPWLKSQLPAVDVPIQQPLADAAKAIEVAQQVAAQPPKEGD